MAAIKFVLLFAALSVTLVSAEGSQDVLADAFNALQNVTQKLVTDLNTVTGSDSKLVDVLSTQVNAFTANVTDMLSTLKADVAAKFSGGISENVNVSLDSILENVRNTMGLGTELTPEKMKQNVVQGLENFSSQFRNLTSNLEAPVNEITQTFAQSLQQAASAVENMAQKIQTNTKAS